MHVESDPPGAVVTLNDREVGRTPFDVDFLWYGNYDVVARLDGFQTVVTNREITAPWWQWMPFDLLTDCLPVRDDERIELKLTPEAVPDPLAILYRGQHLQSQLQSSKNTVNKQVLNVHPTPATKPTTTRPTR